jgi:hypothetical protein
MLVNKQTVEMDADELVSHYSAAVIELAVWDKSSKPLYPLFQWEQALKKELLKRLANCK